MQQPIHYNLTECTFEEFVSFIFDREIPEARKVPKISKVPNARKLRDAWYYHAEVEFDPRLISNHYIKLFQQPEFLLKRFSRKQLQEGFWAILGPNLECSASRLVLESELPLEDRKKLIRSMIGLFTRLFARDSLETAPFMWWDSFCYDWKTGHRNRNRGREDKEFKMHFSKPFRYCFRRLRPPVSRLLFMG